MSVVIFIEREVRLLKQYTYILTTRLQHTYVLTTYLHTNNILTNDLLIFMSIEEPKQNGDEFRSSYPHHCGW